MSEGEGRGEEHGEEHGAHKVHARPLQEGACSCKAQKLAYYMGASLTV